MNPDDYRKHALGRLVKAREAEPSKPEAEQPDDNTEAEAAAPDWYIVVDDAEFDFTGLSGPNG